MQALLTAPFSLSRTLQHHSFKDFIACARHLHALGYSTPSRTAARGASAGMFPLVWVLARGSWIECR